MLLEVLKFSVTMNWDWRVLWDGLCVVLSGKCSYVLGWFAENVSDSSSVPQSVVQHGDDAHQQSVAGSLRVRLLCNTHTHGQCCSIDMRCNNTRDFIDLVDHRPPALTDPPVQPQRWSRRCSWLRLKNTTSGSPERLRSAAELNNTTHQSYWTQFNPTEHNLPDGNFSCEYRFSFHLQHTQFEKVTHTLVSWLARILTNPPEWEEKKHLVLHRGGKLFLVENV